MVGCSLCGRAIAPVKKLPVSATLIVILHQQQLTAQSTKQGIQYDLKA